MGAGQEQLEDIMRQPAEILFRHELEALRKEDTGKIPAGWQMSLNPYSNSSLAARPERRRSRLNISETNV